MPPQCKSSTTRPRLSDRVVTHSCKHSTQTPKDCRSGPATEPWSTVVAIHFKGGLYALIVQAQGSLRVDSRLKAILGRKRWVSFPHNKLDNVCARVAGQLNRSATSCRAALKHLIMSSALRDTMRSLFGSRGNQRSDGWNVARSCSLSLQYREKNV